MKFYTPIFKLGHKWYFNLCSTAFGVNKVLKRLNLKVLLLHKHAVHA